MNFRGKFDFQNSFLLFGFTLDALRLCSFISKSVFVCCRTDSSDISDLEDDIILSLNE